MVRKAWSPFALAVATATPSGAPGDPLAGHLAGAEGEHPARRDRHLDARLGVASHALALVAQDEAAEARDLDVLAVGQSRAHMVEDALDDPRRFGAGEADLTVYDIRQIGARQSPGVDSPHRPCVGHNCSLPPRRS